MLIPDNSQPANSSQPANNLPAGTGGSPSAPAPALPAGPAAVFQFLFQGVKAAAAGGAVPGCQCDECKARKAPIWLPVETDPQKARRAERLSRYLLREALGN